VSNQTTPIVPLGVTTDQGKLSPLGSPLLLLLLLLLLPYGGLVVVNVGQSIAILFAKALAIRSLAFFEGWIPSQVMDESKYPSVPPRA